MNTTSSCNHSKITEFLLVGFSAPRPLRVLLFSICLVIYIMALGANLMIIALYLGSHHLRSPMYFFLSNLSATDILLSTTVGPNLLCTLLKDGNPMSVSACVTQFFAYGFFTGVECFLLTVMAYDRYLAICKPLHYVTIMTNKHCLHLVIWSWLEIILFLLPITVMISHPGFCGCNTLDYIYCDTAPLLKLSCSDVFVVERAITVVIIPVAVIPLLFILTTYAIILLSIFRISSNTGRQKAFSTCSSHLTVVSMFYGILIAKYTSGNLNKLTSLLYTLVTPLFNPIVYSLRNQDIQKTMTALISVGLRQKREHMTIK
uniref:Olfactory receptor n=1 Tax=Xenopus tropicalis TaxID=8364 RepID=F6RSR7_XENTR